MVESVSIDSSEEDDEETKKAVKNVYKKIKKDKKKVKKLVYNKEEYIVDNWIECEKCKTWRIVNKNPEKYKKFVCKNANKKCKEKENVPKNLFIIA